MKYIGMTIITMAILFMAARATGQTQLTLDEAIRLSQEHSNIIQSAKADSLAAIYDYKTAAAQRYPTLSLSAASFYIDEVQKIDLPLNSMEVGSHENYQADFRLAFPLYTGGRISSQVKTQRELAGARAANLQAERLKDAYQARKAYLAVMAAQAILSSAQASLERVKTINRDVQNLYSAGLADSVDLLDAESSFQRAQQNRNEKLSSLNNVTANLARMLGWGFDSKIVPADSAPTPDYFQYENAIPDSQSIARAELDALERRARAARFAVGVNRAGYFPSLSAFGGYSIGKPNRDVFNNTWNDYFSVGLNLNWEFNLGGRTRLSELSARQTANSLQLTARDLRESLQLGAQVALENLHLAYNSFVITGQQYEIAQRQYRLARERQKAGRLSINRLVELESDLTVTEQLYQSSLINYYLSETEYLYSLGSPGIFGGF